jgi:hypothetical protein
MLFMQGTRDALADTDLMVRIVERLGPHAALRLFAQADHSFRVPARSGTTDAQMLAKVLDAAADWMAALSGATPNGRT